jgi:streptomycin 6-kinase
MLSAVLPAGAVSRLTEHYGDVVRDWLDRVEDVVRRVAARWAVDFEGYQDAGWTSVVAVGHRQSGQPVAIKAMPETARYLQERAALTHWAGHGVCRLLEADDTSQVLLLELVGDTAGGAPRPADHADRVAEALPTLHRGIAAAGGPVSLLTDYYRDSVLPRIDRRADVWGAVVGENYVRRALAVGRELSQAESVGAMLHSDLYAENVLFDARAQPVFIDPHAKIGSPAFDWAFWCVYYVPTSGFEERVASCRAHVPALFDEVLAWTVTLAVDGALYYLEDGDTTATAMQQILRSPVFVGI